MLDEEGRSGNFAQNCKYLLTHTVPNYWVFGHFPSSGILENTTFRKLDLFPSSDEGEKIPTQLGSLERANLNHWTD
jgi:hypothetical protein